MKKIENFGKKAAKEKNPPQVGGFLPFFLLQIRLFGSRSLYGESTLASTALNALVGIDNILAVLFGNSAYRANISAGTATDALFGIDNIRHNYSPFLGSDEILFERCLAAAGHHYTIILS